MHRKDRQINLASFNDNWAETNVLNEHTRSLKTNDNVMLPPQNGSKFSNIKETEA